MTISRILGTAWPLMVGWMLVLLTAHADAGYRGLTDEHMVGYINSNRVITIDDGAGGHVQGMVSMLARIADTDRRVVIDGPCRSACTLLTSLGPSRVCVTPRAELWFHQASFINGKRSKFWTDAMLRLYPAGIRSYVRGRGGLRRGWIVLKGQQLARVFPNRCGRQPAEQQRTARPRVPVAVGHGSFASQGR